MLHPFGCGKWTLFFSAYTALVGVFSDKILSSKPGASPGSFKHFQKLVGKPVAQFPFFDAAEYDYFREKN